MIIDHIGIVVKSIEAGIRHWTSVFGYNQMTAVTKNSRQMVNVVFMQKKDSILIKLVEPENEQSPVYRFARRGGGLHHLCFKSDDMAEKIISFKQMGLRELAAPQPGEAFNNKNIAFLFTKQGINIELIDTDQKANMI